MAEILHVHLIQPALLGHRKNGRPIYSIAGGNGEGGEGAGDGATSTGTATGAGGDGGQGTGQQNQQQSQNSDPGFPANTTLEQMNADQREAYWKHQARKHEDRVKAFGGLTAEQLTELREKAGKHDQMERDLLTGTEKAVAEAKDAASAATKTAFIPKLVNAELRAAAAGKGITSEALATALEYVDQAKFLTKNGDDVDTDKVSKFIAGITPDRGNNQSRKGPTATGHGSSSTGQPGTGSFGAAGHAEAQKRFAKQTQS